jgi:hypothetical protein
MDCQFPRCPRVSLEKPVKAELGASAVAARIAGLSDFFLSHPPTKIQ